MHPEHHLLPRNATEALAHAMAIYALAMIVQACSAPEATPLQPESAPALRDEPPANLPRGPLGEEPD